MTSDDAKQSIFGLFDGLASAIGMIAALAIAGNTHSLLVAALALAAGAAVSMGCGEWLSDPEAKPHRAVVMGAATLVGSSAPAVPFAFLPAGIMASAGCALVTIGCGAGIAEIRPGARGRSYALTFTVLVLSCVAGVAASLLATGF